MEKGYREFLLVICNSCGWTYKEKGTIVSMWVPVECESQMKEKFRKLSSTEKQGYIEMANNVKHQVWIH